MTPTVREIWDIVTEWAPHELAESWDNVGLQVGNPDQAVNRVMVALDASEGLLDAARSYRAEMVITHHPLLFHPLKSFDTSKHLPRLLAGFLRSGVALASAHTNLDSTKGGVNDVLTELLDLADIVPLIPNEANSETGLGRVGRLAETVPLSKIILRVAEMLSVPGLMVVGNHQQPIRTVALCSGSGSDLWPAVVEQDADLFISAEIKHHVAREAQTLGKAIIDAGHFYTEWVIVPALVDYLREQVERKNWNVEILLWEDERAPLGLWVGNDVKPGCLVAGSRPTMAGKDGKKSIH